MGRQGHSMLHSLRYLNGAGTLPILVLFQNGEGWGRAFSPLGANSLPIYRWIALHVLQNALLIWIFGRVQTINVVLFPDLVEDTEHGGIFDQEPTKELSFFHERRVYFRYSGGLEILGRDHPCGTAGFES